MKEEVSILIAEDDPGHMKLLLNNLRRSGIKNKIYTFSDGQEVLDYLFRNEKEKHSNKNSYLLLLDIRMPKVDGFEVLDALKKDNELKKIPVIILTTTDDPQDIERCYNSGCSTYIVKPVDYEHFIKAIKTLGLFLSVIEVPECIKLFKGNNENEKPV